MIIDANLKSKLSIIFWEDFQKISMHYNRKMITAPVGASFIDRASLFKHF